MTDEQIFTSVNVSTSLVERVVDEIERKIVSGQLRPDTKLPPQRRLAEDLGVSRTVIREAVSVLEAKGLLETKRGIGTLVRQITRKQLVEVFDRLLQAQDSAVSFEDLYEVRVILEVEIAEKAAMRATEDDVAALREFISKMEASVGDPKKFSAEDALFHWSLAKATQNELLALLLGAVRDLLEKYIVMIIPHLDVYESVLPYHYSILQQVEARNVDGARQAMIEHLEQIRRNHEKVFGE